jgi:putative glutamine amidotransferase
MTPIKAPGRAIRIGISACFFHADPQRAIFKGKTLQYVEQSLARWVLSTGVIVYMIPSPAEGQAVTLKQYAEDLDGLVLQGGSDVSPESYGEKAKKPEWNGDRVRDLYEMELYREFTGLGKPVLGVCRGLQLLNVACGGTLIQDIATELPKARNHRNWEIYDQNFHEITFEAESKIAHLTGKKSGKVNTIHHQAIRELGKGLEIEAKSAEDGVIEAVRATGEAWVYGMQWHPEFHDPKDKSLLDARPVLEEFLEEALEAALKLRRK